MEYTLLTSFGEIMSYVGYIALALVVLLIMITVHELGHYISGKIFKFGIEEFAIGFGPKIFRKKRKNGEYFSLRLIPLGGFCSFKGEDADSEDPSAFNNKKPWQRIIVLISGALMNFITAILFIVIMFGAYGQLSLMTHDVQPTTIEYNLENSFNAKDVIISVNGKNIYLTTDLMDAVAGKKQGDEVECVVKRNDQMQNINVKLRKDANFNNVEDTKTLFDVFGIYYEENVDGEMVNAGLYSTSVRFGFFETIGRSFEYAFKLAGTIFTVLKQLLTGQLGVSSMGGTITTITVTANAIKLGGLRYLLNIAGFIGVNLAVFNLLPIPALDGSRVVFTTIEWIRKKPLNRRAEAIIHAIGFVLLLLFAVFVDLQRCF